MARFDKYDPVSGGFRAKLGFAIASGDVGVPKGVQIDGSGLVQLGGAAVGDIKGVICPSQVMSAGDVIDVMTSGEIVDVSGLTGVAAGDDVYAAIADGVISDTNTGAPLGFMVEAWRMIVRRAGA